MEEHELAKRILQDLETVFKRNNQFATFEIVPLDQCIQNKCPILQVDDHLAIESWCTRFVYKYAYTNLISWRSGKLKAEAVLVLEWTRVILLLCQEVELAWNIRKELIGKETQAFQNELNFNALVLSWKPKSSHAFAHRRWVLGELLHYLGCLTLPDEILDQELTLCQKTASSYRQNYYSWSHRIWVISRNGKSRDRITKELQSTEEWLKCNISDHCCFHYRQFLFSTWIQNDLVPNSQKSSQTLGALENDFRHIIISFLLRELRCNSELVLQFEGHETLWYHRRFILWTISRLNCNTIEQSAKRLKFDLQQGIDSEVVFLQRCSEVTSPDSWQKVLLERHSRWLKTIFTESSKII